MTLGLLASFGACLSSDRPFCDASTPCLGGQSCDLESQTCLLVDEPKGSPEWEAAQTNAVPPPPGDIVATAPNSGWTEGHFSVSDDGAAEYHLPLWVPDGRRGVQPSLALHYNSRNGNGMVGVGWSLQGLSSITPCPRTLAQDERNEAVRFTADDAYCLDGQRLRPTTASGWPTVLDQEYRTERDTFSRIIAHTLAPPIPGATQTQPHYFKVWTKDSRILTFGGNNNADYKVNPLIGVQPEDPEFRQASLGTNSRLAWLLRKIEDRNGNAIDVEYTQATTNDNLWLAKQMMPSRLTYGPDRRVDLIYEDRPDSVDRFQAGLHGGMATGLARRLKTIQMYAGTQLLREYRLTYDNNSSITGRSLLMSVSECDSAGICLEPLRFDWSPGSYDFEVIDTDITDVGAYAESGHRFTAGDINGDGADDLLYGDSQNNWRKRFSNRINGFGAAQDAGIPRARGPLYQPKMRPVDYDRDGRLDLAVEVPDTGAITRFALYHSNNGSFQLVSPPIDTLRIGNDAGVYAAYFADLDGNGLPDYIAPRSMPDQTLWWRYRLNFGSTFGAMTSSISTPLANHPTHQIRATEFHGNGRAQFLVWDEPQGRYQRVEYGDEMTASTHLLNLPFFRLPENEYRSNLHFADVNGDGLEDAVYPYTGLRVQLNSGAGFSHLLDEAEEYVPPGTPITDRGVRIADFNGDGADDVLLLHDETPNNDDDYERGFQLYVWSGNRFVRKPIGHAGYSVAGIAAFQPLDYNGDGNLDIAHLWGTSNSLRLRLLKRQGQLPDRLIRVNVSSLGPRVEVDYATLADNVHAPGTCTYPLICPRRGGSIVKAHRLANGLTTGSPWHEFKHKYKAARVDITGRGWLGFEQHEIRDDEIMGPVVIVDFDNTAQEEVDVGDVVARVYPLAHQPVRSTYRIDYYPTGSLSTFERITTWDRNYRVGDMPGTYTVELENISTSERESLNSAPWTDLRSSSKTFEYGDFGTTTKVTTVVPGSDRVEEFFYRHDQVNWLLGLLETRTTTSCTRADNECVTREAAFDHEANGNLKEMTVEPLDEELRLQTVIEYGSFGNVTAVTISDSQNQARRATVTYDSLGLHPATFTNALEHVTQASFHTGLGVALSQTDANGVSTTMKYDGFGRLRETNHTGGYFERLDTLSPIIRLRTVPGTTPGTTRVTEAIVLDKLGRPQDHRVEGFDGRYSVVRSTYDRFGRLSTISHPFRDGETIYNTTYRYDSRHRLIEVEEPDGAAISHEYIGLETHTEDANGNPSFIVERPDGRVASRFEDDPDSDRWLETKLEYGPFGLLAETIAPDGTSQTMEYDRLGRRIEHVDPSAGTTTSGYNAFGELVEETDGASRQSTYAYDVLGRLTLITAPEGQTTNTWDASLNGIGKLSWSRSPDGVVTRHRYNDLGLDSRLITELEGNQYLVDFTYDAPTRRLMTVAYPQLPGVSNRLAVNYRYTESGYLSEARDTASDALYWRADSRNAALQLEMETYGNNVIGSRDYFADSGLLQSIRTRGPTGELDGIDYEYDANRNVTLRQDVVGSNPTTQTYTYDSLDRLQNWDFWQNPAAVVSTSFRFDSLGNVLSETVTGRAGRNVTYRYGENGAPPHALTWRNGSTYSYDDAGRQLSGPNRTVAYNRLGLPTSITRSTGQTRFAYDAFGARVLKRDPAMTAISVPGFFERRIAADVRSVHYINADGRAVAHVTQIQATPTGPITGTQVAYLHPDGQGTIIQATAPNGTVSEEFFYDPFGRRTNANHDPLGQQRRPIRLGYTSHEHDDELGLIDMGGRIYDPDARRFLTPDPFVQSPLFSQSHNRYAYVWNNPATFIDPTGFQRRTEVEPGKEDRPAKQPPLDNFGFNSFLSWVDGQNSHETKSDGGWDAQGQPAHSPHSDDKNETDPSHPGKGGSPPAPASSYAQQYADYGSTHTLSIPCGGPSPACGSFQLYTPPTLRWSIDGDAVLNAATVITLTALVTIAAGPAAGAAVGTLLSVGQAANEHDPALLGIVGGGVLGTAAGSSGGARMALGIATHAETGSPLLLNRFAARVGAKTYGQLQGTWWPGSMHRLESTLTAHMQSARSLHFNLDQFNPTRFREFAKNPSFRMENVANWELYKILTTPNLLNKTTFYEKGGRVVAAPSL